MIARKPGGNIDIHQFVSPHFQVEIIVKRSMYVNSG